MRFQEPTRLVGMILIFLSLQQVVVAQDKVVEVKLECDVTKGLSLPKQIVSAKATLKNLTDEYVIGTVSWEIKSVNFKLPGTRPLRIRLNPNESRDFIHSMSAKKPGFAEFVFKFEPEEKGEAVSERYRFGVKPDLVKGKPNKQEDFDEFWESSIEALKKVKPDFTTTKHEENETNVIYEVTMKSFGEATLHGWLEVPKAKGPFPVVVRVPGYSNNLKPVRNNSGMIVFSLNPRGHGKSTDKVPGEPLDFWIRGLDRKEDYFYRGAFLDCVRAIDFICSRDDVDQSKIAIWGGSQGGGLAFATAALDKRVDLCIADIPWLCDWANYLELTEPERMDAWIKADSDRSLEKTLKTLSYFDALNLADRIDCKTIMSVGLQDRICPPVISFNAFSRIPIANKSYHIYDDKGHGLGDAHYQKTWKQIRSEFGVND